MNQHTTLQERFTNKKNINLLWNVLLDEFKINNSNKKIIDDIKIVFESNIKLFITRINPNLNIMELNKQFLSQVVLAVNKLFPNFKNTNYSQQRNQEENIKRITIHPDEVDTINEPYKIEDIQASRQSEFDKNVEQKRADMENYMIPRKPKELDFSDKNTDNKITSMDSLIAEKMAQRNLEIEHINFDTSINTENWLTPKETSVKNEKTMFENKNTIKNNENSRLKHISIDSNNNIKLSINETKELIQGQKRVSWNDSFEKKESTNNIFNKLKKQPIIEKKQDETNNMNFNNINKNEIMDDNINKNINENNEKRYAEQKSMPLPEVKQEEIIRNQTTQIVSNNDPILPKTEIVKQLNEMNKKIDNLYEIVLKLTGVIEKNVKVEMLQNEMLQNEILDNETLELSQI